MQKKLHVNIQMQMYGYINYGGIKPIIGAIVESKSRIYYELYITFMNYITFILY